MQAAGMLALALLAAAAVAARAAPAPGDEKMGVWVPLYVDTLKAKDPLVAEYKTLISSVENDPCLKDSFHGTVLTGPRSGPPNASDPWEDALFRKRFASVAETGQWTAFGYAFTNYASRPLKAVLRDIEAWLAPGEAGFGDMVQGIWVDQVVNNFNDPKQAEYYKVIADTIKNGYGKIVAFNPGSMVQDCKFLEDIGVDFVNNFENTYKTWQSRPSACTCKDKARCIASIHSYPKDADEDQVLKDMQKLYSLGYRATFLTDRVFPDHYNGLPTVWPEVVSAACKVDVSGKSTDGGDGKDAGGATGGGGGTDASGGKDAGGSGGGGDAPNEPEGVLPPPLKPGEWWRPTMKQRVNYQFTPFDAANDFIPGVQVYVLPLFGTSPETLKKLKYRSTASHPVYTVCHFSAISAAPADDDWKAFDATGDLTGPVVRDGPVQEGEMGVDWKGSDAVRQLMAQRLKLCKAKGFDGAEPAYMSDYVDPAARVPYLTFLAKVGHELGLAVGASGQAQSLDQLIPYFDFFTTEWCSAVTHCNFFPVTDARAKLENPEWLPIWDIEWGATTPDKLAGACEGKGKMFGMRPIGKTSQDKVDKFMVDCPQ